jgi:23S rRNA (uracil1939-C5)-methyltransferase
VVLAERVAPGDVIVPTRMARRGGTLRILDHDRLQAGPDRIEPPCPWARQCGGCDWMHLSEGGQASGRSCLLTDALRRLGRGTGLDAPLKTVSPGPLWAYRQRLRLHVTEEGQIGFRATATSTTVPIDQCLVARDPINVALARLAHLDREHRRLLGAFATVEIRSAPSTPELTLRLTPRRSAPRRFRALESALGALGPVVLASSREDAELEQHYPLPRGVTLSAAVGAFTQVHPETNDRLVEAVASGAEARGVSSFFEPYAGAGNFTLPLLRAGLKGHCCDRAPTGVASARRAARRQGLPYDGFDIADASRWLGARVRARQTADLLLLDPPRQGVDRRIVALSSSVAQHIALIACEPVSLARDLSALHAVGFSVESLTAFNMFPQTHHIEALAWLARR